MEEPMSSMRSSKFIVVSLTAVMGLGITSAQAKPQQLPAAPRVSKVVASNGSLTVNTTVPRSPSAILNFEYSVDGGTSWTPESPAITTGPVIISGLINGQTYQVAVRAVNVTGAGLASNIKPASPATVPDAPHLDFVTGTGMWFNLHFTAGASDGASPITQWQFDIDQTGVWKHWGKNSVSPQVVMMPWAKLGESHILRVRAVNAIGVSSASNSVTVTLFKTGLHTFDQ
jgi:large repetitive protein